MVTTDARPYREIRDYLAWRARVLIADRLNDLGASVRVRMDRDPVLTEALRLVQAARTQDDLYAAARRTNGTRTGNAQPRR